MSERLGPYEALCRCGHVLLFHGILATRPCDDCGCRRFRAWPAAAARRGQVGELPQLTKEVDDQVDDAAEVA
jgi:predicted  nucleic acid-binding Zn-ribbon protein